MRLLRPLTFSWLRHNSLFLLLLSAGDEITFGQEPTCTARCSSSRWGQGGACPRSAAHPPPLSGHPSAAGPTAGAARSLLGYGFLQAPKASYTPPVPQWWQPFAEPNARCDSYIMHVVSNKTAVRGGRGAGGGVVTQAARSADSLIFDTRRICLSKGSVGVPWGSQARL